jgi:hypothetical protein
MTRIATLALMILAVLAALSALPPPPARAQLGSPQPSQVVTTATYSDLGRFDTYQVDATAGAVTLKLLDPSRPRKVTVIKTDSSANAVTITTAGTGATINGASSYTLRSQNDAVTLVANGRLGSNAEWFVSGANRRIPIYTSDKTIATTGTTEWDVIAPESGQLVAVAFSGTDALAASDTNYITFSIQNMGQDGLGTNAMLAATSANTTKATGGTAIAAAAKRPLTLNGTASNLAITHGDRLRVRATVTGTLANTVTFSTFTLRIAGQ